MTTTFDSGGREYLVIVAKATWRIPKPGQRPHPLTPQPLSHADQFYGEPGLSPLRYGDDFARHKPRCDVIFDACARAPGGKPITALAVQVQVGAMVKLIKVQGPRIWKKSLGSYEASQPAPFIHLPLHYGFAFGGTHPYANIRGQELTDTFLDNPVGIGWVGPHTHKLTANAPIPCLEAFEAPIMRPTGNYRAVALSAIPRYWPQRAIHAGTYDEAWHTNQFPFLPENFDERYHQCAPLDQQIDYPQGGEEVRLIHVLSDWPSLQFRLPNLNNTVRVLRSDYSVEHIQAVVDTLFFETEAARFSAVWRTSIPIRRRIQEFDTIAVGPVDPAWWRSKALGIDGGCGGCVQRVETAA
ncbi:DUF2169 family type VI secretion system accessory protein [Pseudomonas paralcaligenes]|uniref:DUF2169 family type VI secretion system accessory protein n=1 Tax=Pseudomonas paralcaligenes TaxID=2772558 RepID=UPI001C815BC8|nr:DUF2169 domain-containing protein [Pseudomonas paralcaligenes]